MLAFLALLAYTAASGALSLLWLLLVWLCDRYEREPPHTLLLAVFWGAVPAVFVSCLFELAVSSPVSALAGKEVADAVGTILVAPVVEEALKAGALLLVVLFFRKEFDGILDGMVYGAAVGIGFSFVEDLAYFTSALLQGGASSGAVLFALRNLAFVLNHSLFTALTGIGFGLARTYAHRPSALLLWPLAGYCAAVAAHALHNGLALLALPGVLLAFSLHWAAGLVLLGLVPFLWALERRWILRELGEEIQEGSIPKAALDALPFSGRPANPIPPRVLPALRRAVVRLAFRRRQAEEWARDAGSSLGPLRAEIRGLLGA